MRKLFCTCAVTFALAMAGATSAMAENQRYPGSQMQTHQIHHAQKVVQYQRDFTGDAMVPVEHRHYSTSTGGSDLGGGADLDGYGAPLAINAGMIGAWALILAAAL